LLSAILAEQERRVGQNTALGSSARREQTKTVVAPPTFGKLNAICAAFKVGVTPSRIAREFGLSQSDVRKALRADKATR
jgi:predicted transcriptional regulator